MCSEKTPWAVNVVSIVRCFLLTQEAEVGANPVQVETGEFDEAIEAEEDAEEAPESMFKYYLKTSGFVKGLMSNMP